MVGRLLHTVAVCFLLLCLLSCNEKTEQKSKKLDLTTTAEAEWNNHLAEYSQGWISAEGVINFRFRHPVVNAAQLNKPLDGVVRIDPVPVHDVPGRDVPGRDVPGRDVPGRDVPVSEASVQDVPIQDVVAVFTANDTMEVRHQERFTAGSQFEITLLPEKLENLPTNISPFRYKLQVLEQQISIREIGLVADPKHNHEMHLEGELETGDSAPKHLVEKIINATYQNKALPIIWRHLDDRKHQFSIESIERNTTPSDLRINWDASGIGTKVKLFFIFAT